MRSKPNGVGRMKKRTLHEMICVDLDVSDCELVDKIIDEMKRYKRCKISNKNFKKLIQLIRES